MPTSVAGTRLLRFLLLFLARLRRSARRVALALRAQLASLWRSVLAFGRPHPARVLHPSNDVPGRGSRPEREATHRTLAALPVRENADWRDDLRTYQTQTSLHQFKFAPVPATPDGGSQRYEPRSVNQSVDPPEIPAGQDQLLSALERLPDEWTRHVHPEGNVLFYHTRLRIFTESDITDRHHCQEIMFHATALIQTAIDTDGVTMDELTEIVLNMDGSQQCHYYFVDHTHRVLFWVHPIKPQDLDTDLRGISDLSHIRYLVESQYWYASRRSFRHYIVYDIGSRSHCEYYPNNRTLPEGVFGNLRGMLNYAQTDMITTDSSSSPFAKDELGAILNVVNSLNVDGNILDPYSIWIIARLMTYFTESQFLSFCGQPCARLNADTPLFGEQTWNRSLVFQVLNVFLLASPNEHAARLQRVWVDGIIIQPRWKDFINRLTTELTRYPIFSTVMLAVNFSFLAVPGVVAPGTPASQIQIIIYCSVVSTIASIVFSFALSNVYSDPQVVDANAAANVMRTLSRRRWGMACLAVMHSLPIACLVWSITLFSAALAIQIFGPKERATVTTLGAECFILVLCGLVSRVVMRLFPRDDMEEDGVEGAVEKGAQRPAERLQPPSGDMELGTGRWCVFAGR